MCVFLTFKQHIRNGKNPQTDFHKVNLESTGVQSCWRLWAQRKDTVQCIRIETHVPQQVRVQALKHGVHMVLSEIYISITIIHV